MNNHLYILEPYKGIRSRYECPGCGKKQVFSRYVNTETGEYLADHVGRCNREVSCDYHYKPKQYFADNGIEFNASTYKRLIPVPQMPVVPIPYDVFEETLTGYESNNFVSYLLSLFGPEVTEQLIAKYYIGTTDKCGRAITGNWKGACVFWYIDIQNRVRAGQVKQFETNGHTAKYINHEGERKSCTDAIHTPIKRQYESSNQPLPEWLESYLKQDKRITCFFGETLLNIDRSKPIAICEAPKTAIIASVYFPDFIWLAVGALSYLTEDRCKVLAGKNVVLFPDLNAFDKWSARAIELGHITKFKVSDILEAHATEAQRKAGLDLADFLEQIPYDEEPEQPMYNNTRAIEPERKKYSNLPEESKDFIQPLKEPVKKEQDILDELERFFAAIELPDKPVCIAPGVTVLNIRKFVESHLTCLKSHIGNKNFDLYSDRLNQLKAKIS